MRQTSQISKSASLRAGFAILSIFALSSLMTPTFGANPASMAPTAAEAPPAVPGKPKADAAVGEALYNAGDASRGVVACITCHGPKGQSAVGTWPKLSAQHAAYTAKQLKSFKEGSRVNAIMMGMAMPLNDQDMLNIATYLSQQAPSQGVAQNKETIGLGQSIYRGGIAAKGVPACAGCHSPNGAGIPSQYPRQGGQWAEYSYNQLINFHEGTRKNAQMNSIANKLSDQEMKAVSDYMAGLH
jgi:cytochrome c553